MLARILLALGTTLALVTLIVPKSGGAPAAPVDVLVLGTYHMGNPGADVNNYQADDVLAPRRQRELEALSRSLARYRPTKILIEEESRPPEFASALYAKFAPEDLGRVRNELTQIAFRLAHRLGQSTVYGIDEQPGPGEPDYFPYDKIEKFLADHGRSSELSAMNERVQRELKALETRQAHASVAELLAIINAPSYWGNQIGPFYYESLGFGDGDAQPGAELNAGWYLRNAKIFAKLMQVARPGDRLLVLFGSGHNYWLRHFARETPGYRSVDPRPYLGTRP